MKRCSKCKIEKDESDFYKRSDGKGLCSQCKECTGKRHKQRRDRDPQAARDRTNRHYAENKESHREQKTRWYYGNHDQVKAAARDAQLVTKYGITRDRYNEMLAEQNFKCANKTCPNVHSEDSRLTKLCVDHDHTTGMVRGLLCQNCNATLGHAKDNIPRLFGCIEYLKGFENITFLKPERSLEGRRTNPNTPEAKAAKATKADVRNSHFRPAFRLKEAA